MLEGQEIPVINRRAESERHRILGGISLSRMKMSSSSASPDKHKACSGAFPRRMWTLPMSFMTSDLNCWSSGSNSGIRNLEDMEGRSKFRYFHLWQCLSSNFSRLYTQWHFGVPRKVCSVVLQVTLRVKGYWPDLFSHSNSAERRFQCLLQAPHQDHVPCIPARSPATVACNLRPLHANSCWRESESMAYCSARFPEICIQEHSPQI